MTNNPTITEEQVILVNEQDEPIGLMEKMEAHKKGVLHRAFSVFLVNDKHEMLLQRRALTKYHSGGLLTNACCSHQRANEPTMIAATRRCIEELGFAVPMDPIFEFIYKASFENNLTEYELDHVLFGHCEKISGTINKDEVAELLFVPIDDLEKQVSQQPELYTAWFVIALPMFINWYNQYVRV